MNQSPFGTRRTRELVPWLGIAPGLLIFLLFTFLPACAVLVFSFTNLSGVPNVAWGFVGWENYDRFLFSGESAANLQVIQRTLGFMAALVVVQNLIALGVAVLLNRGIRGAAFFRAVVFLPVILGVTVIGLVWSLVLDPVGGPVSRILGVAGVDSALLGDTTWGFPIIVVVQMWSAIGYSMIIFLSGLQAIPADLHEAAIADGANLWQRFRHVTWPLLAPAVNANVIIGIIGSLKTYQLIWVLSGGRDDTVTLPLAVFLKSFGLATDPTPDQGYASALSVVQFILIACIALPTMAILRRREVQL